MQLQPYDIVKRFTSADWGSNLDLTGVSGAPPEPPDQIDVLNLDVAGQAIVFSHATLSNGVTPANVPFTVAPGTVRVLYNTRIAGVVNSGTGTIEEITAYWRFRRDSTLNP